MKSGEKMTVTTLANKRERYLGIFRFQQKQIFFFFCRIMRCVERICAHIKSAFNIYYTQTNPREGP